MKLGSTKGTKKVKSQCRRKKSEREDIFRLEAGEMEGAAGQGSCREVYGDVARWKDLQDV